MDDAGDGVAVDEGGPDLRRSTRGRRPRPAGGTWSRRRAPARCTISRMPMHRVPMPSQTPSSVARARPTPTSARTRPMRAPKSSSRTTGSSGALARRMNCDPGQVAAQVVGLLDGGAEGEALGDDREDQDADRPVPVLDGVRVPDLLVALVEREHAADGEQDDGDEEAVDVAFAAVAEGVFGGGLRAWPSCRRASSRPWLPESASECTPSASIEEEPLKAKATNLLTAMARLAPSAATIALVPPDALMCAGCPFRRPCRPAWRRVRCVRGTLLQSWVAPGLRPPTVARKTVPSPAAVGVFAGREEGGAARFQADPAAVGAGEAGAAGGAQQDLRCAVVERRGGRRRGRGRSGTAGTRRSGCRRPPRRRRSASGRSTPGSPALEADDAQQFGDVDVLGGEPAAQHVVGVGHDLDAEAARGRRAGRRRRGRGPRRAARTDVVEQHARR